MMTSDKIAFLVPAHNEETVIADTIKALLQLTSPENIYVISDGSVDATEVIARQFTANVLALNPGKGKASAINTAVREFGLASRYDYIMPMDADTQIRSDFLEKALPLLENDKNELVAAVVGKVVGRGHNWITMYRIWEYEIAQTIHKASQSHEDAVIICPGCSTIYRSRIFEFLEIPTGTLTEDMDFTFLMHRKKVGKIKYIPEAVVVTQDPGNVKDFIKQIMRWYTGFWQCILKHNIPWEGQMLDFEVSLLALEGLFNGLLMLFFLLLIPAVLATHPAVLILPFLVDFFLFLVPTMIFAAVRHDLLHMLLYIPHFYCMRAVSSFILLITFFKVIAVSNTRMHWGKIKRY